jgi:hypothetical protein
MIHLYAPIELGRTYRTGAEEEYAFRGRTGPKEEVKDDPMLMQSIPRSFFFVFKLEPERFIKKHELIRPYSQYSSITEFDPEF